MYTDWHSLGEILYRKWHVYDMSWKDNESFDISKQHFCGAPFGGPIAVITDLVQKSSKSEFESKLKIFTTSGALLADVSIGNKKLAGSGWSDQEQLVIVLEDGKKNSAITSFHLFFHFQT